MKRLILLCALSTSALADNAELNLMLEQNATAAAFARLCNDEPTSDRLKSTTMLLLAYSGIEAQNIQLGSAKFNDVLRQELRIKRKPDEINCTEKLALANNRLTETQDRAVRLSGRK